MAEQFPLHTLLNSAAERSVVARMLSSYVPEFTNHRITDDRLRRLKSLLSSAAVVVGLGKPFDPALALLAMAQGAVFLNPTFDRPRLVLHNTTRLRQDWLVTSQHTYLERFVKAPTVVRVPVDDRASLPVLLKKVAASVQKGKINYSAPNSSTPVLCAMDGRCWYRLIRVFVIVFLLPLCLFFLFFQPHLPGKGCHVNFC